MNHTQKAIEQIGQALNLLKVAKFNLSQARSEQCVPLAAKVYELEEILATLKNPDEE